MTKQGGSLSRGRRRRDEVPDIPDSADLNGIERTAQAALRTLVEKAGGRFDSPSATRIPAGHVSVLADLLDRWGRDNAEQRAEGLYFSGRPGLWHSLDRLYPLQDPNRWDALRMAVIIELEDRGWRRVTPPRGTAFYLPER